MCDQDGATHTQTHAACSVVFKTASGPRGNETGRGGWDVPRPGTEGHVHVGVRACLRACGHLGHGAASLATSFRRWPWRCVLSSRIECAFNGAHDRCQRAGPARGRTHIARAAKLGRERRGCLMCGVGARRSVRVRSTHHRRRRVLRSTARSWRRPAARPEPSRPLKPLFLDGVKSMCI